MSRRTLLWVLLAASGAALSHAQPGDASDLELDGIRGQAPFAAALAPAPLQSSLITDDRYPRISHEQPPLIPHRIDNYRVDGRTNDCLSCHAPVSTADAKGPPLSPSHVQARNGRPSDPVAAGHYFCTTCHLSQTVAEPPLGNGFQVLATVPYRRYLCGQCHPPQFLSPTLRDGSAEPRGPGQR